MNYKNIDELSLLDEQDVVSMTECTGLIAALPQDDEEENSYNDIYRMPDDESAWTE